MIMITTLSQLSSRYSFSRGRGTRRYYGSVDSSAAKRDHNNLFSWTHSIRQSEVIV